jgi:hypothetical protein
LLASTPALFWGRTPTNGAVKNELRRINKLFEDLFIYAA